MKDYVNASMNALDAANVKLGEAVTAILKAVDKAHAANYSPKAIKSLRKAVEARNEATREKDAAREQLELSMSQEDAEMLPSKPVAELDRLEVMQAIFKAGMPTWRNRKSEDKKTKAILKSLENRYNDLFPYFYRSGYLAETDQYVLKLMLKNGMDIAPVVEDVKKALELIEPITVSSRDVPEGTKGKYIDIFEHTLSEHGSYCLICYSERDIRVYQSRYLDQQFENLESAIQYVADKLWYE